MHNGVGPLIPEFLENKCILQYYTIHSCMNPPMQNLGCGRQTIQLYVDNDLKVGVATLTSLLDKGQLEMVSL